MTNVKVQIPNECQMKKSKTNNHESTKIRKHEIVKLVLLVQLVLLVELV